jgi:predicted RNase H-like HicB family nuclease
MQLFASLDRKKIGARDLAMRDRGVYTMSMKLKIVVEADEDGVLVARCPSLKGCWSQGKTKAEAVENIKEAILLYLDAGEKSFKPTAKQKVLSVTL